jgi:hypothetical protein
VCPETGLSLWVPSAQINMREKRDKRDKRDKSPSHVPACRFFSDRGRSASVASGVGRPQAGVRVFSKLSKLLNQEDALSAPCLKHFPNYYGPIKVAMCGFLGRTTSKGNPGSVCIHCESAYAVISALRRRPRGAQDYRGQACSVALDVTLPFCYTQVIMRTSADAFPVVGGRCTGRKSRCMAKQGRCDKTALICGYLLTQ